MHNGRHRLQSLEDLHFGLVDKFWKDLAAEEVVEEHSLTDMKVSAGVKEKYLPSQYSAPKKRVDDSTQTRNSSKRIHRVPVANGYAEEAPGNEVENKFEDEETEDEETEDEVYSEDEDSEGGMDSKGSEDEIESEDLQDIGERTEEKVAMLGDIDVATAFLTYRGAACAHTLSSIHEKLQALWKCDYNRTMALSEVLKARPASAEQEFFWLYLANCIKRLPRKNSKSKNVDPSTIAQNKNDKQSLAVELKDIHHRTTCTMPIGEVTSQGLKTKKSKVTHDPKRVAILLKEALEFAGKEFGVEDAALVGLQVVANKKDVHVMARVGHIYVLAHQGDVTIPNSLHSLSDIDHDFPMRKALEKSFKQGIEPILKAVRQGCMHN
ncbi:hypothetical protein BC939DRAFT_523107 [Gamsiella multidivaricata]|uniref:uncharacterized protein n=1 Tax=Gamsiella multidivaricata TaxID=101098 RepID=UPI00221F1095|nr:uncharacterized protein BC939DRAFT_523107 [Gamsiella multidivaricata]KAI7817770.1 hypothetical protein BC939DRAFT_523107 [Gamsiella multidivaricata]